MLSGFMGSFFCKRIHQKWIRNDQRWCPFSTFDDDSSGYYPNWPIPKPYFSLHKNDPTITLTTWVASNSHQTSTPRIHLLLAERTVFHFRSRGNGIITRNLDLPMAPPQNKTSSLWIPLNGVFFPLGKSKQSPTKQPQPRGTLRIPSSSSTPSVSSAGPRAPGGSRGHRGAPLIHMPQ